jgi:hypothetical protein
MHTYLTISMSDLYDNENLKSTYNNLQIVLKCLDLFSFSMFNATMADLIMNYMFVVKKYYTVFEQKLCSLSLKDNFANPKA